MITVSRTYIAINITVFLSGFLSAVFLVPAVTSLDIKTTARTVVQRCQNENFRPRCYDKEIPNLMGPPTNLTLEQAFAVTKEVQEQDPQYRYCHVLGHALGSREVKKNPSKWKDVIGRCPGTTCNNGCPHGVLMGKFQSEHLSPEQIQSILPDIQSACEITNDFNPASVEQSMCYHGLGHLAMYITNADIRASSQLCQKIGMKNDGRSYVQTCTEGVFMSIFQPLDPEDVALVKKIAPTTPERALTLCQRVKDDEEMYNACRKESWPLYKDNITSPQGLLSFCSYTEDVYRRRSCITSMMNHVTVLQIINNDMKLDAFEKFCLALSGDFQRYCFFGGAMRLLQIDTRYAKNSYDLCVLADRNRASNNCINDVALAAKSYFRPETHELETFCTYFPDNLRQTCLQGKPIQQESTH